VVDGAAAAATLEHGEELDSFTQAGVDGAVSGVGAAGREGCDEEAVVLGKGRVRED